MSREVYVTGIGIVSPAGDSAERTWLALLAGGRFARRIGGLHLDGEPVIGAQADVAEPMRDRSGRMAAKAMAEAMSAARLAGDELLPQTLSLGSSKPIVELITSPGLEASPGHHGGCRITGSPYELCCLDASWPQQAHIAPRRVVNSAAACASGTFAVIRGAQLIHDNDADLVLCGAADASLHTLWLAAYRRMGVLAVQPADSDPAWACRPFDRHRNGFVVGEGAAFLVLETATSARRRGSVPVARLESWATVTDPTAMAGMRQDGSPLTYAIALACRRAGRNASELRCIHAHGTGTVENDQVEARAIRAAMPAAARGVPVVSLKGAIGHLMGAAGAVELAVAARASAEGRSPANSTLCEADPALGDLCLPRSTFTFDPGPILKTSMGFGGHIGAVILGPP